MATVALALPIIVGWFGWTYWLAILFGFVLFRAIYRQDAAGAARVASAARLTGPLIALALMWIGSFLHGILT